MKKQTSQSLSETQKEFLNQLEGMDSCGLPITTIFDDFLFMASTAIRQSVHVFKTGRVDMTLERSLLVLKPRYLVPNDFGKALGALTMGLTLEPHDFLGQFYGAIEATNARTGQFFTPDALSEVCTRMLLTKEMYESAIAKGKRFAISEPCVGAGGFVIQAAKLMREFEAHPSTWYVDCTDIDLRCVRMAYIQLSLLHIPAIVRHGNTLSLEQWDCWGTLALAMNPLSPIAPVKEPREEEAKEAPRRLIIQKRA